MSNNRILLRSKNENILYKLAADVDYLVERLHNSTEKPIIDKLLTDIISLKIILEDNKDCIEKEEYYNLRIDPHYKKRAKDSRDYTIIKGKKNPDILVEETTEGNICLITQKEIEERVEAPCGHVFDKRGIEFLYTNTKSKNNFQCPYVGCKSDWYKMKYNPFSTKNNK